MKNGGWHFTNIRKPEDLEKKLLGFLHHVDYENSGLKLKDLKNLMNDKRIMYNHSLDKRENKWGQGKKLKSIDIEIKRLGWNKEQENNYIKQNFGAIDRNRITNYRDLSKSLQLKGIKFT